MPTAADVRRMQAIVAKVRAHDVRVIFVDGWQSRGGDWGRVPDGVLDHHDASSVSSGTWGALGIIVKGRPDVPGPLSQFQVARGSIPQLAVVAAGRANHAGLGGPINGIPRNDGNAWMLGAEKANNGTGELYTEASIHAASALFASCAEVCDFPVSHVWGHKEWAPDRKIDPRYDMDWMRREVTQALAGDDDMSDEQYNNLMEAVTSVRKTLQGKFEQGAQAGLTPRQVWAKAATGGDQNAALLLQILTLAKNDDGLPSEEVMQRIEQAIESAAIDVNVTVRDETPEV